MCMVFYLCIGKTLPCLRIKMSLWRLFMVFLRLGSEMVFLRLDFEGHIIFPVKHDLNHIFSYRILIVLLVTSIEFFHSFIHLAISKYLLRS